MVAFATCADFSTKTGFEISCTNTNLTKFTVTTLAKYPFSLDHNIPDQGKFGEKIPCGVTPGTTKDLEITFPGNFSSDAEFFVFIGVVTWLYCFLSIAIYVFYSSLYDDEQKNYPQVDFVVSVILSLFWLAGSSAWAHGLSGLKSACDPDTWIYSASSSEYAALCYKTETGSYQFPNVQCSSLHKGTFGGANVSVVLGFLNCFLWSANLWFLYKDTAWFKRKAGAGETLEEPTV